MGLFYSYAKKTLRLLIFCFAAVPILAQEPNPQPPVPPAPAAKPYDPPHVNLGIGAMLPKNVPWKPLTMEERRRLFINDAFKNPRSLGGNFIWAVSDMAKGEPKEWRQGMPGFGMRLASRYGRTMIGNAIQHGGAALLKTDIRYVRSKSSNPMKRIGNAVWWQFFTYNQNGHFVFDLPGIGAAYAQEIIGVQWMPGRTVTGYAIQSGNQQMVQGVVSNIIREFLPDMKRMFKRKSSNAVPPPPATPHPPPPDGR